MATWRYLLGILAVFINSGGGPVTDVSITHTIGFLMGLSTQRQAEALPSSRSAFLTSQSGKTIWHSVSSSVEFSQKQKLTEVQLGPEPEQQSIPSKGALNLRRAASTTFCGPGK